LIGGRNSVNESSISINKCNKLNIEVIFNIKQNKIRFFNFVYHFLLKNLNILARAAESKGFSIFLIHQYAVFYDRF